MINKFIHYEKNISKASLITFMFISVRFFIIYCFSLNYQSISLLIFHHYIIVII